MGGGLGRGKARRIRRKNGGFVWELDWKDAQRHRRRRTVSGTKEDAERVLTAIMRARDLEMLGLGGERGAVMLVEDIAAQYVADLRTRARPRTVTETADTLARLLAELGAREVREITRPAVMLWRQRAAAGGRSNKTVNNQLAALSAALALAVRLGQLPSHPLAGLRGLPITAQHQRRKPRALSDWEIGRLLAVAEESDRGTSISSSRSPLESTGLHMPSRGQELGSVPAEPAFQAREPGSRPARIDATAYPRRIPRSTLLRALLQTGARWGELTRATWADLDLDRGALVLRAETTKNGHARAIPIEPDLIEALLALPAECARVTGKHPTPGSPIFLSPHGKPWGASSRNFAHWLDAMFAAAGIPKRDAAGRVACVHSCRYTFCTRLARAGVPIQVAKTLTGHRTVQILVDVYTDLDLDDARNALRTLSPLPLTGKHPADPLKSPPCGGNVTPGSDGGLPRSAGSAAHN